MSSELTQAQLDRQAKQGVGIVLNGQVVNLAKIAASIGLSRSYLSRLLSGEKELSLSNAMKLASLLGVTIDEFIDAYNARVKQVREFKEGIIEQHVERVERENKEDVARIRKGMPPVPRLPKLRA